MHSDFIRYYYGDKYYAIKLSTLSTLVFGKLISIVIHNSYHLQCACHWPHILEENFAVDFKNAFLPFYVPDRIFMENLTYGKTLYTFSKPIFMVPT